ncbi:hypothetical protein PG987_010658 [Apiospora arundinis]
MSENRGRAWEFSADLPSSPLSGNCPGVPDPGPRSSTFRPPSATPSESDEVFADAADDVQDVDEEVQGYVLQEAELATTRAAAEAARLTTSDEDSDCSVMLSSPKHWVKAQGHCLETHGCDGKDQLGPHGLGLILIQDVNYQASVHEQCLSKYIRHRQMGAERRSSLDEYMWSTTPYVRGMAKCVYMLLAEDMKDITDSGFQSQRAKAALDYLTAQKIFLELKIEQDTLRRGDGPVSSIDPMAAAVDEETEGRNVSSDPALIESINGETRVVFRDWDAMAPLEQARAVVNRDWKRINNAPTYLSNVFVGGNIGDIEICDKPLPPLEKSSAGEPMKPSPNPVNENDESSSSKPQTSSDVDWLKQSDDYKAILVNWGRWSEMEHNVPEYLRHIRFRDSTIVETSFDNWVKRGNGYGDQAIKNENRGKALRHTLKKIEERQARASAKTRRRALRERRRREKFPRAPWRRERQDSVHLRESPRHYSRHRLWRTYTPITVWLR